MEKIDTDYKQQNLKIYAKLFKPFKRDCAPLNVFPTVTGSAGCFKINYIDFSALIPVAQSTSFLGSTLSSIF